MPEDSDNQPSGASSIRQILRLLFTGSKWRLAVLGAASLANGFLEALALVLLVQIANAIANESSAIELTLGPLGLQTINVSALFVAFAAAAVLAFAMKSIEAVLAPRLSAKVMLSLQERAISAFLAASWETEVAERHGNFQATVGSQSATIARVVLQTTLAVSYLFSTIALLLTAVLISPTAAIIIVVSMGLLFVAIRPLSHIAQRWAARHATAQKAIARVFHSLIQYAQEVKVLGVKDTAASNANDELRTHAAAFTGAQTIAKIIPAVYQVIALLLIAAALALVWNYGGESLASLAAIILLLYRALGHGRSIQTIYNQTRQVGPYIDQVDAVLSNWEHNKEQFGTRSLDQIESIRFADVDFSYTAPVVREIDADADLDLEDVDALAESAPAVRGLDFSIDAGECIGIVGPSGSGKSTLVQLLLRLRTPSDGLISLNGHDYQDYDAGDLTHRISYVPQDPQLIEGTVADNIRFLRHDISQDAIEEAARLAHVHQEIVAEPEGYQRRIDPRERALSGGQRQRVCLARSLVDKPDVLILDEPTSALDLLSEERVSETLEEMKGNVTMFIVAHRVSTLNICDRIMVLDEGALKGFETPAILSDSNNYFRDVIQLSQLRA